MSRAASGANRPLLPKSELTTPAKSKRKHKPAATPSLARLQIFGTAPVYVCLKAAGNRTLLNGETLMAGAHTRTFRSSRFDLTLGNGSARLKVNGRTLSVAEVSSGIGYRITPKGRRSLDAGKRPVCS